MAGHIDVDNSLEEGRRSLLAIFNNLEDLVFDNENDVQPSPSLASAKQTASRPQDALITTPPYVPLELRQNNPQDCSNLIAASVNRATVEISRTIIALNATFSQQLQQAFIDKTNAIISANNSATSTISVISSSASVVTSSAFSSLTLANLAVNTAQAQLSSAQLSASTVSSNLDLANLALTSASSTITSLNSGLTSVSSASLSDVSTLSASLSVLQASVVSIQSSASAAIAAAKLALASATGSAAAQASSILASAATATQNSPSISTSTPSTSPAILPTPTIFLTPTQIAAIVIGAVVGSILLSFVLYLIIIRMKRKKQERDSYLDEKDVARSPREMDMPSRLSSTFRTGNVMTIKFNPTKRSDTPPPSQPAMRLPMEEVVMTPPLVVKGVKQADHDRSTSRQTAWAPGFNFSGKAEDPFKDPTPSTTDLTTWPLATSTTNLVDNPPTTVVTPPPRKGPKRETPTFHFFDLEQTLTRKSKTPSKIIQRLSIPSSDGDSGIEVRPTSPDPEPIVTEVALEDPFVDVTPEKEIPDPFEDTVRLEATEERLASEVHEETLQALKNLAPPEELHKRDVISPFNSITSPVESFALEPIAIPVERIAVEPIEKVVEETVPEPVEQIQTQTQEKVEELISPLNEKPRQPPFEEPAPEILPRSPQPKPQPPTPTTTPEISLTLTNLESLLPPQSTRKPSPQTLALLNRDDNLEQARNSTMPEIDAVLRQVARQNEYIADKPLFWTDFRAADPEIVDVGRVLSSAGYGTELSGIEFSKGEENRVAKAEMGRALTPAPLSPASLVRVASPVREVESSREERPATIEPRETTLSPFLRSSSVERESDLFSPNPEPAQFVFSELEPEAHDPSPAPPSISSMVIEEREISPLRMNPQTRNINSLLAEREGETVIAEPPEDDGRQQRGRSMIRTSDLIEARLSAIAQSRRSQLALDTVEDEKEAPPNQVDSRDRTMSPLRLNPVDLSAIPTAEEIREKTLSPLRRNPSNPPPTISRNDSPLRRNPSNPPPKPTSHTDTPSALSRTASNPRPTSRTDSPLRRNPPSLTHIPPFTPVSTSNPASRSSSQSRMGNSTFSQNLSIFQMLSDESAVDGDKANNEVTQRARAGIYIPGSLREQAVRNLSVSRERSERVSSRKRDS
ncbi:hypothetical protein BDZ45DRAFT_805330 [Acephala macrosclerotiorum]|nr:hypothetical protein BDZ45DRAFT_805330 [Acephala macrosclerotiorum]